MEHGFDLSSGVGDASCWLVRYKLRVESRDLGEDLGLLAPRQEGIV